jgi:hypothetical protein
MLCLALHLQTGLSPSSSRSRSSVVDSLLWPPSGQQQQQLRLGRTLLVQHQALAGVTYHTGLGPLLPRVALLRLLLQQLVLAPLRALTLVLQ